MYPDGTKLLAGVQTPDSRKQLMEKDCGSTQLPSGKLMICECIARLRRRADNLQTLLDMLPAVPTPHQEQHLYELACAFQGQ